MKTITLKSNGIGRYNDTSPFIVTDNKLELKVELPNFNGEFYLMAENNSKIYKKLLSRDGTVILDGLTAGELSAEVKHYLKGVMIKCYQVEPLILREMDGSLSGTPEICDLQAKYAALGKFLEEYKAEVDGRQKAADERQTAAEERIEHLTKIVNSLLSFAYKDYKNNVYLDGGPVEKFIKEFEIELTAEEIKLIKGENENADKN